MVQTPNPEPATEETAAHAEYHLRSRRTQGPHTEDEARTPTPSRRLRMHLVLLASDALSPTEIARLLFCSRTTVYALVSRFIEEKRAAFSDLRRRGPKPSLDDSANERIERLVEGESPTSRGWLRSRWSCKLLAY
ncbi:MAG: helix-turn-helix domain-containing protein [Rubrobacter sp.]